MSFQIAHRKKCRVTLLAFVWLFSTVCFQMSPQIAGLRGCIITLVAFVWLFSTVWLIYSLPFLILVQTNAINVNIPLIIKEIYENAWTDIIDCEKSKFRMCWPPSHPLKSDLEGVKTQNKLTGAGVKFMICKNSIPVAKHFLNLATRKSGPFCNFSPILWVAGER